jgi:ribulose-phosphate 3-epimerase
LSPSILTADFGHLSDEIASVAPYVDWFHLDVMDGHYVDNITFGPSIVAGVRAACELPLHVHLMIEEPGKYAEVFVKAGADRISFHPETVADTAETIRIIRDLGAGAGIAVHPDVSIDVARDHLGDLDVLLMMTVRPGFGGQAYLDAVTPKISEARDMVSGFAVDIEVDGGVNLSTVDAAVGAGGEIIVAGSAVFDGVDAPAAAQRMRARLDRLAGAGG